MASWYFPPNHGGEEHGLNEAGVESFKETDSLARETTQNVLDNPSDATKPRVIEFERIDLPREVFPGIADFACVMEACRLTMEKRVSGGSANEKKFFATAESLLAKSILTIPTLRIRDRNTTGLLGRDEERDKPFCRLLRVQGISSPQGVVGGTYGIGQRAPFHCSALRTILFYTRRFDDNSEVFVAKSILCTFENPDNLDQMRQSKGWWCEPNAARPDHWATVRDGSNIEPFFRRDDPGTDLYITGFVLYGDNWERVIRHALLSNFFLAIHLKELVCRISDGHGGTTVLDDVTLEPELIRAAEEQLRLQPDSTGAGATAGLSYLKAFRKPANGAPFTKTISGIGEVRLYVHRDVHDQRLPDAWCYMRKPHMLIGSRQARVLSNFSGLLVCDNDVGNRFLAKLEGKEHREWEVSQLRNPTADEIKDAEKVEKEIKEFVRESLKSLRAGAGVALLDPAQLGTYLPDEDPNPGVGSGTGSGQSRPGGPTTTPGAARVTPVPAPLRSTGTRRGPQTGNAGVAVTGRGGAVTPGGRVGIGGSGSGGGGSGSGGGGSGSGGGSAGGSGSSGTPGSGATTRVITPAEVSFRSFIDGDWVRVIVIANEDITGHLSLIAQGEGSQRQPEILEAFDAATNALIATHVSTLKDVSLKKGVPAAFRIKLDMGPRVCLRVK